MKSSIVVALYNGEKYIVEQMQSLQMQSRKPDEVLFFDDGSKDNTVKIVKEFIEKNNLFSWKIVINPVNKGWEKNFFEGIIQANGDVIFPCDQDDIWHVDKIEKIMSVFENNADALLVASGYNQFTEKKYIYKYQSDHREKIKKNILESDYYYTKFPGCSMGISSKLIPAFKECWRNKTPHDGVLWTIANLIGGLYVYNEALIEQRRHDCNVTTVIAHDYIYKINDYKRTKIINDWYVTSCFFDKKKTKLINDCNMWCLFRNELLVNHRILYWFKIFKYRHYYHSNRQYLGDLYYFGAAIIQEKINGQKKRVA